MQFAKIELTKIEKFRGERKGKQIEILDRKELAKENLILQIIGRQFMFQFRSFCYTNNILLMGYLLRVAYPKNIHSYQGSSKAGTVQPARSILHRYKNSYFARTLIRILIPTFLGQYTFYSEFSTPYFSSNLTGRPKVWS